MKIMKDKIQDIITEAIKEQINEAITLSKETNNIQSVITSLEDIYNRVIHQGVSTHEVTVNKIAKMIKDLRNIQNYWKKATMW